MKQKATSNSPGSQLLIVAGEVFPLAKTGGLGDAVSGLSQALLNAGLSLHVLLPAYRGLRERVSVMRQWALEGLPGGPAQLLQGRCKESGLPCLLLDNPALFDRSGLYVDDDGRDYPDNAARYAALAHAAAAVAAGLPGLPVPDIVHAHDWHAGLVPMLVKNAAPNTNTILTIHNLAFQGSFAPDAINTLGLPENLRDAPMLFAWDRLNFLQAGIAHADCVTTVSRHYASEILTPEGGCGLHEVLAARAGDFIALPNGIDTSVWDPASDPHLENARYDAHSTLRKAYWKAHIQGLFGLEQDADALLVVSCSRLTEQKMVDVTLQALPRALDELPRLQFAVLGEGDARLEAAVAALARDYPGRCGVRIGYDECTAHQLQAGADVLWHPSRFEPFGLTPLYAMRYGTLAIVTAVGGFVDTVQDAGEEAPLSAMMRANGLLLHDQSAVAMIACLWRATMLHDNDAVWQAMQRNAMRSDHGWARAVQAYLSLFAALHKHELVARRHPAERQARTDTRRAGGGVSIVAEGF